MLPGIKNRRVRHPSFILLRFGSQGAAMMFPAMVCHVELVTTVSGHGWNAPVAVATVDNELQQ
jgi:hypothetical protein